MEGSGGSALKGVPPRKVGVCGDSTRLSQRRIRAYGDSDSESDQSPGPPLVVKIILMTVWPVVTVLAVRGLLSGIDKVQDINDVKNVDL
jgi:hypothetical protein